MAPSAFRVRQMPSVLLYRRSEKFDPERFLDEDVVGWGNHTSVTDSLGIKGKRSVMLTALRLPTSSPGTLSSLSDGFRLVAYQPPMEFSASMRNSTRRMATSTRCILALRVEPDRRAPETTEADQPTSERLVKATLSSARDGLCSSRHGKDAAIMPRVEINSSACRRIPPTRHGLLLGLGLLFGVASCGASPISLVAMALNALSVGALEPVPWQDATDALPITLALVTFAALAAPAIGVPLLSSTRRRMAFARRLQPLIILTGLSLLGWATTALAFLLPFVDSSTTLTGLTRPTWTAIVAAGVTVAGIGALSGVGLVVGSARLAESLSDRLFGLNGTFSAGRADIQSAPTDVPSAPLPPVDARPPGPIDPAAAPPQLVHTDSRWIPTNP